MSVVAVPCLDGTPARRMPHRADGALTLLNLPAMRVWAVILVDYALFS